MQGGREREREERQKDGQLFPYRQQMPLISAKIHLTGKRAECVELHRSFKGGPCEFINLLSCVYLSEYIIHFGTSSNLSP